MRALQKKSGDIYGFPSLDVGVEDVEDTDFCYIFKSFFTQYQGYFGWVSVKK